MTDKIIGYLVLDDQQVPSETYTRGAALYSSIRSAKSSRLWRTGVTFRPPRHEPTAVYIYEVSLAGLRLVESRGSGKQA